MWPAECEDSGPVPLETAVALGTAAVRGPPEGCGVPAGPLLPEPAAKGFPASQFIFNKQLGGNWVPGMGTWIRVSCSQGEH